MSEKIGVGIITCQPRDTFHKCFDFWHHMVDHIIVVNDGKEFKNDWSSGFRSKYICKIPETTLMYYHNEENLGVGKSKNSALRHLLNQGCEHIFLIEDDIFIKDNLVFQYYIEASKKSGIQHFNYSQHGLANKTRDGEPNPRHIVKYGDVEIAFYPHCVGAFSYYSRKCLEECGLMDERYYNACEHVDHTYEIIKKGMHPPFWYFADLADSHEMLGDDGWSFEKSSICSRPDFNDNVRKADEIFLEKHGHVPTQTPMTDWDGLVSSIKEIKKKYG